MYITNFNLKQKMKKSIISLLIIFIAACMNAAAKDIKSVELTVEPAMHCASCESKIKNRLKFEKGIKKIDASSKRGSVIVEYDAEKINTEKICNSLKKAGYQAKEKKQQ